MSLYCISTPTALKVAYTATPGSLTGYASGGEPGRYTYQLVMTTDAWVAQGIADTPIIANASSNKFAAPAHGLITGMPIQIAALGDTAISQAWQVASAGPTFVDLTAAINNGTVDDAQPFPTGEVLNDYFAVGYTSTFGALKINLSTAGTVGTLTWEYWNGSAWAALTGVTDGTTGLTTSGTNSLTFTVPSDWAAQSLNGSASLYYVRARVLTAFTVDPLIAQAWFDGALPGGVSGATTYWVIAVDANTFQIASTRANAIAGTAIDVTTNGGGIIATTVAVAGAAGSAFVPAKVIVYIDGALGAKISVVQDAGGGNASLCPILGVK
jgi:hypothetical protein